MSAAQALEERRVLCSEARETLNQNRRLGAHHPAFPTDQLVLKSCVVVPTPARYQASEQTVEHHCEEVVDEWGIPVEQQAAAQRAIVRYQLVGPAVCERWRCRSESDRQSAVERGDAPVQCDVIRDQTDHRPRKP